MRKPKSYFAKVLVDFFEITIISSVVVLTVTALIGHLLQVSGASMYPNLNDGEQLLTERISYKYMDPKRGDIIVFKQPLEQDKFIVKRIVGMPGETLTIKSGKVYINQEELAEPYMEANTTTDGRKEIPENIDIQIPTNAYIVLGDNREESLDSRNWGLLSKDLIVGRALLVFSPLNKMRLITH